ncbi:uncharacterized protein IWZ02DRAFT_271439 [Phyllosticta citriasiana]|uniref:uncharacterized protein n=1 Tax=Phyllosticta citriasiana TaxID=595635 RepID=UPI0030FD497D
MHLLASLHNLYPRFWPFASTLSLSLGAEVAFFSRFLPFVFVLVCPRVADSAAFLQLGRHCLCHGALRSQHLSRVCFPNTAQYAALLLPPKSRFLTLAIFAFAFRCLLDYALLLAIGFFFFLVAHAMPVLRVCVFACLRPCSGQIVTCLGLATHLLVSLDCCCCS